MERLASLLWRLRRIPVFEAAIMRQAEVDDPMKWLDLEREGLTEEAIKFRILGDALIQAWELTHSASLHAMRPLSCTRS